VIAGKTRVLLENMLAAIGLNLGDQPAPRNVLLLNFVPWRPPGNRQPLDTEIAACLPFAARAMYQYPYFTRTKYFIENLPFVPLPPNEPPGSPAGLVPVIN
jgi:hypothetical protein